MTISSEIVLEPPSSSEAVFRPEELSLLNVEKVPRHVAIVMDGNRRWARQRGLPVTLGHWEGAEVLTLIVNAAAELGIKTLTVYSFSTENRKRSESEIEVLMNIFELYLLQKQESMIREGIRLESIGDLSQMPTKVQEAFKATKAATQHCNRINLILAVNYGGRDEIRRAVCKLLALQKEGLLKAEEVTEELISSHLDTARFGDPDLLIRTSGELRMSNFLLWQSSYTELHVTDVLWPDFLPKHLLDAVLDFQSRVRRKGGS
jgi:undecaprenyl diphosphate synthase